MSGFPDQHNSIQQSFESISSVNNKYQKVSPQSHSGGHLNHMTGKIQASTDPQNGTGTSLHQENAVNCSIQESVSALVLKKKELSHAEGFTAHKRVYVAKLLVIAPNLS